MILGLVFLSAIVGYGVLGLGLVAAIGLWNAVAAGWLAGLGTMALTSLRSAELAMRRIG